MELRQRDGRTTCRNLQADVVLLHYGELSGTERSALETHLQSCSDCRAVLDEMATLMPLTVRHDDPPPAFWAEYSTELRHKIETVAQRRTWRSAMASWLTPGPLATLAACAIVLLALTFTVGRNYLSAPDLPDEDEVIDIVSSRQDLDLLKHLEVLDALDVLETMSPDNDNV